ncbi:MAG: hypothetical protein AB4426_22875 [Xenococcaceae cyanobacterium]
MQFTITISPRTLTKRLTIVVLVLTAISIAIQIGKYVFNYRSDWTTLFNLDREMNLPTWYTALMLAFCALLLRAIAVGKETQRDRYYRHWKILSIIFWLLAIDEVLTIHEILIIPDLSRALPWIFYSVWVIPGIIAVLVFVRHYWKFTAHLPKRSRYHFILAAMLYVGGALGMEMVGGYYTGLEGQQHLTYALIATLEEVMEMMGVIFFIYGLLFYIGRWTQDLQVQVKILEISDRSDSYK